MTTTLQRSPDGSTGWADITGTTDVLSYVEAAADAGYYLRVKEVKGGVTVYSNVIGPVGGSGPAPSAYPSRLRTSGGRLVDEAGAIQPMMRGFNVQVAGWSAQSFLDMYAKGARLIRTVIFWDSLEPNQGAISASYISTLDTHIQRLQAAGLYTTFCFYFGPGGGHSPTSWGPRGNSNVGSYVTYGQNATQYLANRYGNPTSPKYTKAVIGFGLNEPTPDSSTGGYLLTLMSQQQTMMQWFRADAPNWIGIISGAYGNGILYPNAPGSGHGPGESHANDQTFTIVPADPFSGMGNWMIDLHCYALGTTQTNTTPVFDGRGSNGIADSSMIRTNNASYTAYPAVGTRTQSQQSLGAYFAPALAFCGPGHANVPLMNLELGWDPPNQTSGGDEWTADVVAALEGAGGVGQAWWDYNTSYGSDPYAARPGATAPGAGPDGWQTAVDVLMAAA